MVYGGVGLRGIEMSRAILSGFAFIHDAIGVALVDSVDWFLPDDPKQPMPAQFGFTAGSVREQLALESAKLDWKASAEANLVAYLQGNARCAWNERATKFTTWTGKTVLDRIKVLGNNGKDSVILVLAGHGSKAGTVAIDCSASKPEQSIDGNDLAAVAGSCRELLAIIGACYGAAVLKDVVIPPNLIGVASAAQDAKDDHRHLQLFLVAIGWALETIVTEFPARCRVTFGGFEAWFHALVANERHKLAADLRAKKYGAFQQASSIEEAQLPGKLTAIVRCHQGAVGRRMMSIFDVRAEQLAALQEEVLARAM